MTIGIQSFKSLSTDYGGRVVAGADDVVSGHQCAFGRLISVITGARQTQNRAVYQAFKEALGAEYGEYGEGVLSSLNLKDGSKLSAANVRRVLDVAEAAREQYAALKIPMCEQTRLGRCTDASRCGTGPLPEDKRADDPTAPGVRVDFGKAGGSVLHGRFKAEVQKTSETFVGKTGIPPENPQFGLRCIASSLLDKLLGLDVIVPVEFGVVGGKLGIVELEGRGHPPVIKDYDPKRGSPASDVAGPKTTGDVRVGFNRDAPLLLKKVNDLQWLDALCGQVGRGSEGYRIEQKDDGQIVDVKGVQNGLSLGKLLTAPDGFPELSGKGEPRFSNLKLPSVISEETAKAFKELTEEKIKDKLAGLLSDEEVAACVTRLKAIQQRLAEVVKEGDKKGQPVVAKILSNEARDALFSLNRDDGRQRQPWVEPETWHIDHTSVSNWLNSKTSCYVTRDRSDVNLSSGEPVINYRDVKL